MSHFIAEALEALDIVLLTTTQWCYLPEMDNLLKSLPIETREQIMAGLAVRHTNDYHDETLGAHSFATASLCCTISSHFGVDERSSYIVGLLHDIGKIFAVKTFKKDRRTYTGHAQVGAALVSRLSLSQEMVWAINHHMCRHQPSTDQIVDQLVLSLSHIQDKNMAVGLLACLSVADFFARNSKYAREANLQDEIEKSKAFMEKLLDHKPSVDQMLSLTACKNNTVIILPFGPSGSGKSFMTEQICKILPDVVVVARDDCYYQLARDNGIVFSTYKEAYDAVMARKDLSVPDLWASKLRTALESGAKYIVVDTLQTCYPALKKVLTTVGGAALHVWQTSFKIVLYGFPAHQLGIQHEPKTGKYSSYPVQEMTFSFPSIFTEVPEADYQLGTSSVEECCGVARAIIDAIPKLEVTAQCSMLELCRRYPYPEVLQRVAESFPPGVVYHTVEYSDNNYHLVTFSYANEMQHFNGPTRDYRGETILWVRDDCVWTPHYFRAALPVIPELHQFKAAPIYFRYFAAIQQWDALRTVRPLLRDITPENDFSICITAKVDGSLFNCTVLNDDTPEALCALVSGHRSVVLTPSSRCLVLGSKNRVFASDVMYDNIIDSIKSSFGSVKKFGEAVDQYLDKHPSFDVCTLHFEAVPRNPHAMLAVYYGKDEAVFFGATFVRDAKKQFVIGEHGDFPVVASSHTVQTLEGMLQYYNEKHEALLSGDETVHPEGFVVHFVHHVTGEVLSFKYKFPEYFAAHKPSSSHNSTMTYSLMNDEKYAKLRQRLNHFREKPKFLDYLREKESFVSFVAQCQRVQAATKKDWALTWRDSPIIKQFAVDHIADYRNFGFNMTEGELVRLVYGCIMRQFPTFNPDGFVSDMTSR